MAYALRHPGQVTAASGLDVLAAIWILISPFVMRFHDVTSAMTNNVILGIVIGVLALSRFFKPTVSSAVSWVNVLLGIWMVISPWVLGFDLSRPARNNNVIMGILVIILAAWSALASTPEERLEG